MASIWINGRQEQQIDARDRGLAYGDGFFTTISLQSARLQLWPLHLERIKSSLNRLCFPDLDLQALEQELFSIAEQKQDGVLKLIITRGVGGKAYSFTGCSEPQRIVAFLPRPAHYSRLQKQGIALMLCQTPISGIKQLAGLKTLNRLEQVLIKQELEQASFLEGVVCDVLGNIVECCSANIFWREGKKVYTPRLDTCGVNGVMRQHVMTLLPDLGFDLSEVTEKASVLEQADEVFITNSLMPILPVSRYNGHPYKEFSLAESLLGLMNLNNKQAEQN